MRIVLVLTEDEDASDEHNDTKHSIEHIDGLVNVVHAV